MSPNRPERGGGLLARFLRVVEVGGNALPHPATLFLLMALVTVAASGLAFHFDVSAVHPKTGETVRAVSLLSIDGLHRIMRGLVTNFTDFAPLGTVLVALLGIGIAESSGLIGAAMRKLVLSAPPALLTWVVVFAGVLSNAASEIGYVLLVPMAAVIFQSVGRHPIAGLAAAFAGVSGGYSANLVVGTIDPLLAGLSEEAARILEPGATVSVTCNYWFMFVSTFLVTAVGALLTDRVVEPRLGKWSADQGEGLEATDEMKGLEPDERHGLKMAMLSLALMTLVLVWSALPGLPGGGFLLNPEAPAGQPALDYMQRLVGSPLLKGVVALIFVIGAISGIVYGVVVGTFRSDAHVMKGMAKSMSTLGEYMVLVFFAAQFVAFFNWTNIGLIFAVKGAESLKTAGFTGIPLVLSFVALSAVINLFMGSASAKWAIMAPVFVPMMMQLGYSPEVTQAAYRVGDSTTNIISPMMSYFALIIAFFQRYDRKAGIGTLVATMLPYSIAFFVCWCVLLSVWLTLGLPLGF